jgi:hypothetical protein
MEEWSPNAKLAPVVIQFLQRVSARKEDAAAGA